MKHTTTLSRNTKTAIALAAGLILACSSVVAPAAVHANPGSSCSAADPITGGTLRVVSSRKLYSSGERRFHGVPTGAAIGVLPKDGMTEADLHRAASCYAGKSDATSPLGVEGVKVRVERSGGLYVLHITSKSRAAALEIQRRAEAAVRR